MPAPFTGGMPPDTELDNGCRIVFDALSPVDGQSVGGVVFTEAIVYVDVVQGSAEQLEGGPFMLVPGPGA